MTPWDKRVEDALKARITALEAWQKEARDLLQAYLEVHACVGEKAHCEACTRTRALLGEDQRDGLFDRVSAPL